MWTLNEALQRTLSFTDAQQLRQLHRGIPGDASSHDTDLNRLRELRTEVRALEEAGSSRAAADARKQADAIEARIEDSRARWHDTSDALHAFHAKFRTMMAARRLAAFGQLEGGNGELVAIPARAWRDAEVDWDASALRYGSRSGHVRMVSVRVRPLLHLPGAPALPAARSLASAFRTYVLDDPALAAILDRANGSILGDYACICSEVARGMFTHKTALWPAAIEEYDLAVEWMVDFRGRFTDRAPADRYGALDHLAERSAEDRVTFGIIRAAEDVVLDRVKRFLEPLRSGAIVASGEEEAYMGQSFIPPDFWSRPTVRIDFMRSEMWTTTNASPRARWTGLVLSRPEKPHASLAAPEATPRNKGGRPATHAWPEAFDLLARRLGKDGTPTTGAALARMMANCFTDMRVEPPDHEDIISWLKRHKLPLWKDATGG